MINNVVLEGRLTKDPEIRFVNDSAVTSFRIAVANAYRSGDEWKENTTFIDVECWGKLAERIAEQVSKGELVMIFGSLRQSDWEDKDGNRRSKHFIRAKNVRILPSKQKEELEDVDELE